MLTSNNQYLRPDYLSPLPTTLDAKKSPLALLAQTCSNIGADNPNHKPLIPTLEKSKDVEKSKEKSMEEKSFKPYESSKKEEKSSDNESKTPTSKSGTPATGNTTPSGNGSVGPCGKSTPSSDTPKSESSSLPNSCGSGSASQNTLSGLGYGSSLGLDLARGDSSSAKDSLSLSHLGLGAYKGLNNAINPLVNCAGCTPVGGPIPVDAATTGHTFPPSIATQSGMSPLKPSSYSTLSPYVGYARVKTAAGGTTLVPVCRDPYCTNCQFSLQSAQLSSCPGGCTQCTHDRLVAAQPGLPSLMPSLAGSTSPAGGGPGMPGFNSQLYSPSVLARPNVCSWMVGDTYCGKRFATSEELLQHLRTHTNLSAGDSATTLPVFSPALSVSPGGLAACHLHYTSAPSLTTPAGLRRTYPTSLSPVTGLSANRYHPYKPSIPAFPTAPLPSLPHPSLGMYYSPYSLYGQRLGPPVHP